MSQGSRPPLRKSSPAFPVQPLAPSNNRRGGRGYASELSCGSFGAGAIGGGAASTKRRNRASAADDAALIDGKAAAGAPEEFVEPSSVDLFSCCISWLLRGQITANQHGNAAGTHAPLRAVS